MRSFLSCTKAFLDGSDSPRSFLERCIQVIDKQEQAIGAFVALDLDSARRAADKAEERWKRGQPLSLLDGMPIGIKDIMETADMPTEQGSPLFQAWRGGRDAAAVFALREAGAAIIGKTVTTEFASSEARGTHNPHDVMRTPGGSSSGSAAAVASGMLPAALGTQLAGSIIRPASFCGCFGFKPSVGAINRGGSFDEFSQSCTGVLAATLEESWVVARNISARAGGDPGYPGLSGPLSPPVRAMPRRVAMLETAGWALAGEEAKQALGQARTVLHRAGIEVFDASNHEIVSRIEVAIARAAELTADIAAWEGRWPLNTYSRDVGREGLSAAAQERLAKAERMTLEAYQALTEERRRIRDEYATLKKYCELCIALSAPGAAPLGIESTGDPVCAAPASLIGAPALSLPVLQAEGLPLGLQLIGFADADAALFASAAAIVPLFSEAQTDRIGLVADHR